MYKPYLVGFRMKTRWVIVGLAILPLAGLVMYLTGI